MADEMSSPPRQCRLIQVESGQHIGSCSERHARTCSKNSPPQDQDELARRFSTHSRVFAFHVESETAREQRTTTTVVSIRETDFSCGKLGHKLWPSGLVLSTVLAQAAAGQSTHSVLQLSPGLRYLELGAGVGLPSAVINAMLEPAQVVATDFWQLPDDQGLVDRSRYVPSHWHGVNLRHNVVSVQTKSPCVARVERLDWRHDDATALFRQTDVLVGSDLVYDAPDLEPLWQTLVKFLQSTSALSRDTSDTETRSILVNQASSAESRQKNVVLVSPLRPDIREDLPEFVELLRQGADQNKYGLATQELQLLGIHSTIGSEAFEEEEGCFILMHLWSVPT